ncbi:McrC family protein [Acinetobacter sichuanensis]|uniref:McrC family protein n=1 Tax=Acinetobacter sichuanensis TaxID=2136183 RepID=A0A371YNK5_9GAMM|nr:McrC family protein [Acinetobacter sichuanensis]RFC83043.1 restriction endonuclease [Acinetobacter sichuanensis]
MITVIEYAELQSYQKTVVTDKAADTVIASRRAYISQETLDWIVDKYQAPHTEETEQVPVLDDVRRNSFKLGAYVGYIQSPFNNEQIQILPKIELGDSQIEKSKRILRNMLSEVYDIRPKQISEADLEQTDLPLHEWIIQRFLEELDQLIHHGLKRDYELVQDEQPYLKGRLLVQQQINHGVGKDHLFAIEYDEFLFNGIENKLIKTALIYALEMTRNDHSIVIGHNFTELMNEIPICHDPVESLGQWREGKLFSQYEDIKPWCELLLLNINPSFQNGERRGMSLLFSMPQLFEKYVAKKLKTQLKPGHRLQIQPSRQTLVSHIPNNSTLQNWFALEPDLAIYKAGNCQVILDTKWKFIDQERANSTEKYGISQADLYQMNAYGNKYFGQKGQLILIYPKHQKFMENLPKFNYSDELSLFVLPFDLEAGILVGKEHIEAMI